MTKSKKILSNILSLSVAEIASRLLVLFFTVYLARVISTDGFGIISYSQSIIAYFIFFVTLGLDTFGQRESAKAEINAETLVNNILTMRIVFSVISYISLTLLAFSLAKGEKVESAILVGGMSLFSNGLLLNWYFQGIEKMKVIALRQLMIGIFNFIGILLFINGKDDVVLAVFVINIGMLVNTIWLLLYYHFKIRKIRFAADLGLWRSFLRTSVPIGLFFLIVSLYQNMNITLLGELRENFEYESGVFGAAYKILVFSVTPSAIVQGAYFPLLSRSSYHRSRRVVMKSFLRLNFSLGIFFTLFLFLFSDDIIGMAFGPGFEEAAAILRYLSFAALFSYLAVCFTVPFISWSKEKYILVSVITGVILNLILNIMLIPGYGVYGAAMATIASEVAVFGVMLCFSHTTYKFGFFREQAAMTAAGVLLGAAFYFIEMNIWAKAPLFVTAFILLFEKAKFLDLGTITGMFKK